ncbi:hypothetical protein GWI33_022068 [Rhynchophorus ferrugineus]|uniref:Uncharacterized protein n=1 Tax=Rhynchophorus ferrugineus TaxID=354439 RepID=A0A834MMR3_RHYFE|nr:hypothetical protein GWI33_022068 [Rhynchophorus ferrugineus]
MTSSGRRVSDFNFGMDGRRDASNAADADATAPFRTTTHQHTGLAGEVSATPEEGQETIVEPSTTSDDRSPNSRMRRRVACKAAYDRNVTIGSDR